MKINKHFIILAFLLGLTLGMVTQLAIDTIAAQDPPHATLEFCWNNNTP